MRQITIFYCCVLAAICFFLTANLDSYVKHDRFKAQRSKASVQVFIEVGQFYIYTVIGEPNSVVVTGWEERKAENRSYKCCYQFMDGHMMSRVSTVKRGWFGNAQLRQIVGGEEPTIMSKQVVCDISDIEAPPLLALVLPEETCLEGAFVRPVYTKKVAKPSFAICAKISYGEKSPMELIEWMEYHKRFGVDKVVIYPYEDLNYEARRVLQYYSDTWVLEIVPLPYVARLKDVYRNFTENTLQMLQDEQVVNFDAQERLKPYTYFTLMDTDEFITLKNNSTMTLVEVMEVLLSKQKNVASFLLQTEIHIFEWGKTNRDSPLVIGQYGFHTSISVISTKLLHVTSRVKPGSVWVHRSEPLEGFRNAKADANIVVLKHFRKCKMVWVDVLEIKTGTDKTGPCQEHFPKYRDGLLEDPKVAKPVEQNVLDVKAKLKIK